MTELSEQDKELSRTNQIIDRVNANNALLVAQLFSSEMKRSKIKQERDELLAACEPALRYIEHVGASFVMRGQPHPQQKIVDDLKSAIAKAKS